MVPILKDLDPKGNKPKKRGNVGLSQSEFWNLLQALFHSPWLLLFAILLGIWTLLAVMEAL